jgi:hypothetical protein
MVRNSDLKELTVVELKKFLKNNKYDKPLSQMNKEELVKNAVKINNRNNKNGDKINNSNDNIFIKCIKNFNKNTYDYNYTYKKSLFAPINVSKFIKCLPPNIVKDNNLISNKPINIYEIIDNGATPYLVFDYGNFVDIYKQKYNEKTNHYQIENKFLHIKYIKIFVGDNDFDDSYWELKKGEGRGNSILLQTEKQKYLYIGDGIRSFTINNGDVIQKYFSPVGRNAVPYPYAIGNKYIYFMVLPENSYYKIDDYDLTKDLVVQYFENKISLQDGKKLEKLKIIDKRFS